MPVSVCHSAKVNCLKMPILIVFCFLSSCFVQFCECQLYVNNSNVCIAVAIKISLNRLNIWRVQLFVFVRRWASFRLMFEDIDANIRKLLERAQDVKYHEHIGGGHYISVTTGFRCVDFRRWFFRTTSKTRSQQRRDDASCQHRSCTDVSHQQRDCNTRRRLTLPPAF